MAQELITVVARTKSGITEPFQFAEIISINGQPWQRTDQALRTDDVLWTLANHELRLKALEGHANA